MNGPVVIQSLNKNARENVRIALDTYQGVELIDLRVTVDLNSSGIQTPTKKGLSLRVQMLPDLIKALMVANEKAVELGWLE